MGLAEYGGRLYLQLGPLTDECRDDFCTIAIRMRDSCVLCRWQSNKVVRYPIVRYLRHLSASRDLYPSLASLLTVHGTERDPSRATAHLFNISLRVEHSKRSTDCGLKPDKA